jgi:uncharacterized membrane protein (DUF4010 family)
VGLAVGIEREWSGHASGPGARFAGARTFLLLGIVGGVAGWLGLQGQPLAAAALVLVGGGLSVGAYLVVARRQSENAVDGTTEAAALAVLALGFLAGLGELRLAAATGAVIVLALREKSAIQAFVHRIGEVELRAALQFAVLALVLLPILPEGPYGPLGGVRPRELWLVVLIVSGLNFGGYLARRAVGERHGTIVAGILGGLISSTAVALSYSRQSAEHRGRDNALALGVVGACTTLLPRLLVLCLALRPSLTPLLLPLFVPPFLVGTGLVVTGFLRTRAGGDGAAPPEGRSPLRLGSAILLALGFQAVLMIMTLVRDRFGAAGVLTSSALLGLTDMDALTLSMTRLAADAGQAGIAAAAMAIGVLANTSLKLAVVAVVGRGSYRWRAGTALLVMGLASLGGLWLTGWF